VRLTSALRIPFACVAVGVACLFPSGAVGQSTRSEIPVDRIVARFSAPEAGGVEKPHYVLGRELGFEARLLALGSDSRSRGFEPHHALAALERHIAETLIADLSIEPEPSAAEFREQTRLAMRLGAQEVGGEATLFSAASAEGLSRLEVQRVFRRRARASLYLDRMVAPMLSPTPLELRRVHERENTPYKDMAFDQAEAPLRDWYIQVRLREAILTYYQNARTRLKVQYFAPR
jgi:hypothetical protein